MKTQSDGTSMFRGFVKPLLIGTAIGVAVCVLLLLLMALVATWIDVPPIAVIPLAVIPMAIGALVGGVVCARIARRNGWLMGILAALMLFLLSVVAGIGLYEEMDASFLFTKGLIMAACGMVGGIMALNFRKAKRR